jgi:hypothetical protein
MSARLIHAGLTGLITCASGCTSWSRLPDGRPVPARGTVQVWSAGQEILLRDPERVGDYLVGLAPLPDTTQQTVALAAIDSLRIQATDAGKGVIIGSAVAIAVLLAYSQGLGDMK